MKSKIWTKSVGSLCGVIVSLTFLIAGSVAAQVINDPVAYWSFDDTGSLLSNQVISSPYHDASLLFGSPTAGIADGASGVAGNSMMLDGTAAIRLPYHQDNLGPSFTLSFWYWQLTNDTRQCVYQTRDNYTATYEAVDGSNDNFASYVGQTPAGTIITAPKEWINVVHVFSNAANTVTLSVYTNGAFVFSQSVSSNSMFSVNQVRGFHFGAYRSATGPGDGRCFKGMIDELAFWNRNLSSNEVQAVYQRGAGGQKLEFTPEALPTISLDGELSYLLDVDQGIPAGMFNNAWLLDDIQAPYYPYTAKDTAADMLEYVPDTAGDDDGPFHAYVPDDEIKWQVPLTTAMRQLPMANFTVETWFKTTTTQSRNVLLGNFYGSISGIINLELLDGMVRFYQGNASGTTTDLKATPASGDPRDGQWHHLAGIRTNNVMTLYLDGEKAGDTTTTTGFYALQDDYFYLGRDERTDSYPFSGDQGHTRFWTRALSTNELAAIVDFKLPGSSEISKAGLLAEYALYNPFDATKHNDTWYRFAATSPQLKQLPMTNFTCDAVFRTTGTGPKVLLGNYANSSSIGVVNLMLETDGGVRLYMKNAVGVDSLWKATGSINTRDGEWHHLVAIRNDTTLSLYLDGQEMGSQAIVLDPYTLDGNYYYIGKDERLTWGVFDGDIVHARIWNRALSISEVSGLAASNAVPAEGLIAKYDPYVTNTLYTAGFEGNRFLRTFTTATNNSTLLFTDLPNHNKISLGLLLAQLDQLEPVANGDHFEIRIDGSEILSVGLGPDTEAEPQVSYFNLFGETTDVQVIKDTMTLGGKDLFFCTFGSSFNEHVYDLSALDALQAIPHTGSTLKLELLGIQDAGGDNESFGIDQLELEIILPLGTLILIF